MKKAKEIIQGITYFAGIGTLMIGGVWSLGSANRVFDSQMMLMETPWWGGFAWFGLMILAMALFSAANYMSELLVHENKCKKKKK